MNTATQFAIALPPPASDPSSLNLELHVTGNGVEVKRKSAMLAEDSVLPCLTAGCSGAPNETYDVAAVRELLSMVKDQFPDERQVRIVLHSGPDDGTALAGGPSVELLVLMLDASREDPNQTADSGCAGRCPFEEPQVVMAP